MSQKARHFLRAIFLSAAMILPRVAEAQEKKTPDADNDIKEKAEKMIPEVAAKIDGSKIISRHVAAYIPAFLEMQIKEHPWLFEFRRKDTTGYQAYADRVSASFNEMQNADFKMMMQAMKEKNADPARMSELRKALKTEHETRLEAALIEAYETYEAGPAPVRKKSATTPRKNK